MVHLDYHTKIGKANFKVFSGLNFAIISFSILRIGNACRVLAIYFVFEYW